MATEDHVIYSLRYSFEDRMLKANVPECVKADLMGHDINRERYGLGLPLADTSDLLENIFSDLQAKRGHALGPPFLSHAL